MIKDGQEYSNVEIDIYHCKADQETILMRIENWVNAHEHERYLIDTELTSAVPGSGSMFVVLKITSGIPKGTPSEPYM